MKTDLFVQMSGLGYFKLAEHRRKTVLSLLGASAAVFVIAMLALSGIIILRSFLDERTVFTAEPPLKTYQPREMEHRVRVQRRQRSSSRPQITPRLVSMSLSQFALPEIPIDPRVVKTAFQPEFKPVSGMGLGAGVGTGLGLGGFGGGVSEFDFFGIRGRAERIAIILDVSISMAEETEELGVTDRGIAQFARVKQRVGEVIDALSPHSLFNVIVYAETAAAWREELQIASDANKQAARRFIEPFNNRVDWDSVGLPDGISSLPYGLGAYGTGGTTRFDIALSLAVKSGADTILVICDGDVWTTRPFTDAELRMHQQAREQWDRQFGGQAGQAERVWVEGDGATQDIIRERGGVRAAEAGQGRWVTRYSGGSHPPPPQLPPPRVWTLTDYRNHVHRLHEEFLAPIGRPVPTIHVIGFRSGRSNTDFLRRLAREFKGEFRRVTRVP